MGAFIHSEKLNQDFPETSLLDLFTVLFRHKKRILFFFYVVMIMVVFYTFSLSDVYESKAKLMVRLGRESVSLDPTATTGQVVSIGDDRENEVNSELAILQSRELAEKIVDAIGMDKLFNKPAEFSGLSDSPFAKMSRQIKSLFKLTTVALARFFPVSNPSAKALKDRDQAVQMLLKKLIIEASRKSSIITISYQDRTPELARDVISMLIGFYMDKHIAVHRTVGSYQFFDQQKDELYAALMKTEGELLDLKNETGVAVLSEQWHLLLDRIGGLQKELEKTESDIAATMANIKVLQSNISDMPKTQVTEETSGLPNSAADELQKRFNDLQLKEQELLSTFTDESVPVKEIRRQINVARTQLAKAELPREVTTGVNHNYQEARMMLIKEEGGLSAFQAKAGMLREQLTKSHEDLKILNETEVRLTQLQREKEIQEANYRKYSGNLEQARMDQSLEMEKISNISVVQPASFSVKPIGPKKLLILTIGFFVAVFGGLGLGFISEYLDHSFKNPGDIIRKLQLPMMGTIPCLSSDNPLLVEHTMPVSQVMSNSLGKTRKGMLLNPIRTTRYCESLLDYMLQPHGDSIYAPYALAVISAHSEEGVSTVTALVAGMLAAQGDGRILIVDANIGHPGQHTKFDKKLSPGLANALSEDLAYASIIQHIQTCNIDLLAAGEGAVNPGRIADLQSIADLLPMLKREYSIVIFDVPALQDDKGGTQIARIMDGVILVVEAENTRWEVAQHAKERLLEAGANILGVVLNKRRFYIPDWLHKML